MTDVAFVALGSNLGVREDHLEFARRHLADTAKTDLIAESSIEETEPLGSMQQGPFLNQMVLLKTDLTPQELLIVCHDGEIARERVRGEKWGPRSLDLDIVRFGDRVVSEPELSIPHLELPRRGFWIREIAELLPHTWVHECDPGLPDWAQVKPGRRSHIVRVASLTGAWAIAMGIPPAERARWLRAAFLHDALRDAPRDLLWELGGSEGDAASLRHGPAAAAYAEREGESDQEVLEAVRYHSVGHGGWGQLGRILYLADYLEPGRKFKRAERAELAAQVPTDPQSVLLEVARRRLIRALKAGYQLSVEGIEFWNGIAQS